MSPDQITKSAIDVGVAAGALSAPWWLQALQTGSAAIVAIVGVPIVVMRFLIVYGEWKQARGTKAGD